MNRSKLADLSEILSSVAVVVTLVYLTVEVRQNTDALRAQSRQAVLEGSQAELANLIQNPGVGLAILSHGQTLTPVEQVQVDAWLASAFRTREFAWLQYREGSVDDTQWATERSVILMLLDNAVPRLWWERSGRYGTSPAFVTYVDSLMEANPPTGRLWSATWASPDSVH